jgi:hypothetical protein
MERTPPIKVYIIYLFLFVYIYIDTKNGRGGSGVKGAAKNGYIKKQSESPGKL